MSKLEEARLILESINSVKSNDLACNLLLALANLSEYSDWKDSSNELYTTRALMDFMRDTYGIQYKANTRETVRKDVLHYFLQSSIVEANRDNPERATNSPKYCYSLTDEFLDLIQQFGSKHWEDYLKDYNNNVDNLITKYQKEREVNRIPLVINEEQVTFSPGKHNELQKAIIEEFAPIFAGGAEVLYVGDTEKKDLIKNNKKFLELGFNMDDSSKLPDVILYLEEKNWLYFIEAVTSVGPMSDKRIIEINEMMSGCKCGAIFVTAFLDKSTFKKFVTDLAWETEVWIAEQPEHMIHLNGDRFLGPR